MIKMEYFLLGDLAFIGNIFFRHMRNLRHA